MTQLHGSAFQAHHVALSVTDLDRSVSFYRLFGFKRLTTWSAEDKSLRIIHLGLNGFILELFCYRVNASLERLDLKVGNNLDQVGMKHLALKVPSLTDAREHLSSRGVECMTGNTHGRTGIDYFFVRDPDGLWLEVVEDHREWEN